MSIAPRILRPAILATAVGVAWTGPIEAHAAVALCERSLSGDVAEDKSELLAKKRALESWVAHAGRLGEQFTRWGIARNRQFDCTRTDAGLFRCKAVGLPCAIRQVPPADFVPLRRGVSG